MNLLTPNEYAKKHNISRRTVYYRIKQGLLPFKKVEKAIITKETLMVIDE